MAESKMELKVHMNTRQAIRDIIQAQMRTAMAIEFYPTKIIRSGNRTIVFWTDGTKTIVKRGDDEEDNPYHAFTAAVCKKLYGSNSQIHKILKEKTVIQKDGIAADEEHWRKLMDRLREV